MEINSERLRTLRRQRRWTQEELARASGVSVQLIKLYEAGRHGRSRKSTLEKLAAALSVPVVELVTTRELLGGNIGADLQEQLGFSSFLSATPNVQAGMRPAIPVDFLLTYASLTTTNQKLVEEYMQLLYARQKASESRAEP